MADRRGVIVPIVFLLFIFLSPDPQAPARRLQDQRGIDGAIADERHSLSVLNRSSYGDFDPAANRWLNLTGLDVDSGFAWGALPLVKDRAKQQLAYALDGWGDRALDEHDEAVGTALPLYRNATGFLHGKWVRSKVQARVAMPQLNMSSYAPAGPFGQPGFIAGFAHNVTGGDGSVDVVLNERPVAGGFDGNATEMVMELSLGDKEKGDEWEAKLRGIYFLDIGEGIFTTTSDKFAGIFALPQLALSSYTFGLSQRLSNVTLQRVIDRQIVGDITALNPWTSLGEGAVENANSPPNCELIVYLQQLPVTDRTSLSYTSGVLSFLERELRSPTGAFIAPAPQMRFSMLLFSPDCGYILESEGPPDHAPQDGQHLVGPKAEVHSSAGRQHLILFSFVLALQLALLVRQMRETSTPSTRSRISYWSIAMLALGDGFATMSLCLISLVAAGLWLNLIATSFISFLGVSFFGMRFIMDLWTAQAPERARQEREEADEQNRRLVRVRERLAQIRAERQARTAAALPAAANGETEATEEMAQSVPTTEQNNANPPQQAPAVATINHLPLPATAPRPVDTGATPVFMPSDQDGMIEQAIGEQIEANDAGVGRQASFGSLYTRFYLILLGSLFLTLNAASWPPTARRVYFILASVLYLSFWLPQIKRNVQRNCRKALNWEFVAGQSVLRLVPFAYFYGFAGNVVFAKPHRGTLAFLALWLWLQLLVLVSQEIVGPRWFIREDWAPPAYDYHPVLRDDEEGATMPIGFSEAAVTSPSSPLSERRGSARESRQKGKRVFDCAICMQELAVPVVESGGFADTSLGGGLLARRTYMVTPCRHIFHSVCLEGWMKYRLQCPICRETLPPL